MTEKSKDCQIIETLVGVRLAIAETMGEGHGTVEALYKNITERIDGMIIDERAKSGWH